MTPLDHRPVAMRAARGADVAMLALGLALLAAAVVWMVTLVRSAPASATGESAPAAVVEAPQEAPPVLRDEAFGVSLEGLALRRVVQMLQWREGVGQPLDPGDEIVSEHAGYQRLWSERIIDSTRFSRPEEHANPPAPPYRSQSFGSPQSIEIPRVSQSGWRAVSPARLALPENLAAAFRADGAWWVTTPEGAIPEVGDLRVRFELLPVPVPTAAGAQEDARAASDDEVTQALRWIARSAAFILALLGAGLALRAGAALARPGSALARLGGVALLAVAAWVGVGAILVAILIARLLPPGTA
ncbi:MAG TPA: TMEM43 family protein [Chiayiivirga sp.]|nr:TMEM43 family protein [Chiayiivirga sp.]